MPTAEAALWQLHARADGNAEMKPAPAMSAGAAFFNHA
jgi:hypothetical protein